MARRRASVVAVAVCAVALGGCAFLDDAPTVGDAAMTALPLADNLVGESCRAQPDLSRRGAENVLEAYAIFCGRWERPSGGVVRVQAQSGGHRRVAQIGQRQAVAVAVRAKPQRLLRPVAPGPGACGVFVHQISAVRPMPGEPPPGLPAEAV